jgi:hypothetical protein
MNSNSNRLHSLSQKHTAWTQRFTAPQLIQQLLSWEMRMLGGGLDLNVPKYISQKVEGLKSDTKTLTWKHADTLTKTT